MKTLDQDAFMTLLQQADIKPRLKKELKFVSSTAQLAADWSGYELVFIADRTGDKGILLLQPDDALYIVQCEVARRIVDASTGRDRAIICDLCYTWQPGGNAASITFTHATTKHKVRFLCCGDLACSQHVRTLTKASRVSRAQLRESLSNEERTARLRLKLKKLVTQLELKALEGVVR
jgi:hypothetical protein